MSDHNNHPGDGQSNAGILTTSSLNDMVLDHVLKEFAVFVPDGVKNEVAHLQQMMTSLNALAHKIASASIANRQRLSALPTFGGEISSDPEQDLGNDSYELRYRVIEQIGDAEPHMDRVMTYAEAQEEFGDSFMDTYWGKLGEHCPRCVTTGDKHLWFSVVRYPVTELSMSVNESNSATLKMG